MSVELTISKENLNCLELSNYLSKCGVVNANILSGFGLIGGKVENSCTIRLGQSYSNENKFLIEHLWTNIRGKYELECAYFSVPGFYGGCIKNWLRPSICAGKNTDSDIVLGANNG
jgi:hypothetical protein